MAQKSQLDGVLSYYTVGFGAQAAGPAPGRNIFSLYGTVDIAANYIRSGNTSMVRMQSGNVWTSKIGFYGQEDLGGGWLTFMRLEAGMYADAGVQQDPNSFFNRGSMVGLANPGFGNLTIGRQYTSLGAASVGADVFLGNAHESVYTYLLSTAGLGGLGNLDAAARVNKTVRYASPRWAGLNVDASYSFKQKRTVGPATHAQTVSLAYADKLTIATLGYGQSWCDAGLPGSCSSTAANAPAIRTDMSIASLTRDLGPLVARAAYVRTAPRHADAGVANLYSVGIEKIVGANLWRASVAYRDTSVAKNYAYGSTLGVDHSLSKRTALYARIGYLKNGPKSSIIYNYEVSGGNPVVNAGKSITDMSIGISHLF